MQWMLGLFLLLLVTGEMQDLVLVISNEAAGDRQFTRRVVVVDPMAGLAELLVRGRWSRPPASAAVVEDGTALRTDGGLRQLQSRLVRVVDVLPDQPVAPRLARYLPLMLHLDLRADQFPEQEGGRCVTARG